jgi:hypothetical protein
LSLAELPLTGSSADKAAAITAWSAHSGALIIGETEDLIRDSVTGMEQPIMNRRFMARSAAWLGATTAVLAFGAGTASAQTSAPSVTARPAIAQTDPTGACNPSPRVCVFDGADYTGTKIWYVPATAGSGWLSMRAKGLTIPWASLDNNSGSSIVFLNNSTHHAYCFGPSERRANAVDPIDAGYIHIEFGVTDCSGILPPLP